MKREYVREREDESFNLKQEHDKFCIATCSISDKAGFLEIYMPFWCLLAAYKSFFMRCKISWPTHVWVTRSLGIDYELASCAYMQRFVHEDSKDTP